MKKTIWIIIFIFLSFPAYSKTSAIPTVTDTEIIVVYDVKIIHSADIIYTEISPALTEGAERIYIISTDNKNLKKAKKCEVHIKVKKTGAAALKAKLKKYKIKKQ